MLVLSRSTQSLQTPLVRAQATAVEGVNGITDAVRRMFITPIAGQEMIYLNKEQEAIRFLAQEVEPVDLTEYPFIAAEIGSTGASALEVATTFATLGQQWRVLGSMIEHLRVKALTAISTATDEATVMQIVADFEEDIRELQ